MMYHALLASILIVAARTAAADDPSGPMGIEVSSFQPDVDWNAVVKSGVQFAYVGATEGSAFVSPSFSSQYAGATSAGLIRGVYHAAHPDESSGTAQANQLLTYGAGWSPDGMTLPGTLYILDNPDGFKCYDLPPPQMVSWIEDFSNTYKARTTRYPVIHTTADWWNTCTGNSTEFGETNPLWITSWSPDPGPLPAGWKNFYFWQYNSSGPNPGAPDVFNGNSTGLKRMALGT